jgi:hypothetical protein
LIAAEKKLKPSDQHLTTQRPLIDPVRIGVLAGAKKK